MLIARKRRVAGKLAPLALALLAALALALTWLTPAGQARAASYPDVSEDAWYAPWVQKATDAGLMSGYGKGSREGQFGPEDQLTRAQVATVLWRMGGSQSVSSTGGFSDVEEGSWYAQAVAWCAENGIVTGYEAGPNMGKFVPDGHVTRAELAAMAWRYAKCAGLDVTCPDPTAFKAATDWQDVPSWAADAMTWTAAAGVLSGWDNHDGTYTLDPDGGATRAQAAKVFVVLASGPVAPKASHTVTFHADGGSAVDAQAVVCGTAATEPDAPTKDGHVFAGWYSDAELTDAYDFAMPVTGDITLHAKWEERPCAILYADGLLSLQVGPNAEADHGKVLGSWEWDGQSKPWYDMHRSSVKSVVAKDNIALSGDCSGMFLWLVNCTSMDLGKLDVSAVEDFSYMFQGCSSLTSLNLSGWDVPSATRLNGMFEGCKALASLDLSGWDVSKVNNFNYTFCGCSALTTLDLSDWDVTESAQAYYTFIDCTLLTQVTLGEGSGKLAGAIDAYVDGPWYKDVAGGSWYDSLSGSDLPGTFLKGWTVTFSSNGGNDVTFQKVANGRTVEAPEMPTKFGYILTGWCTDKNLTQAYDFDTPVTSDITLYDKWDARPCAVLYADGLLSLQVGPDTDAGHGDVVESWEWNCHSQPWCDMRSSVNSIVARDEISMSGDCHEVFSYFSNCTSMDLSKLDVSGVTSFERMFYCCRALTTLDLSGWDASEGRNFSCMIYYCDALKTLDLSGWNVSKGTNFSGLFYYCGSLTEVTLGENCGKVASAIDKYVGGPWYKDGTDGSWYDSISDADLPGTFLKGRTVTFSSNGGSDLASQMVANGRTVESPETPTKFGYTFGGWYTDEGLTQAYDFGTPVTSDVTLHAKWGARPCAILYADGLLSLQVGPDTDAGHGDVVGSWEWNCNDWPWFYERGEVTSVVARDEIAMSGDCSEVFSYFDNCTSMDLSKLDVSGVTSFSYMFANCKALKRVNLSGWDASKGTNFIYMFAGCYLTEVTLGEGGGSIASAIDKYVSGLWYKDGTWYGSISGAGLPGTFLKGRTVTFSSNGGSDVASQNVVIGKTAQTPETPTKFGYTLAGWYTDTKLTQAYDFGTPVTSNIKLYAKWEARPCAILYADGLLSLQLGPDTDSSHGKVLGSWEWDCHSGPWYDMRSSVTSIVARDEIAVTGCYEMFCFLESCKSMDLGKLDVSGVKVFERMFYGCKALTTLNLSGWDASKGRNFVSMFAGCNYLAKVTLGASGREITNAIDDYVRGFWYKEGAEGTWYDWLGYAPLPGTYIREITGQALSLDEAGMAAADQLEAVSAEQAAYDDLTADADQAASSQEAPSQDQPSGTDQAASSEEFAGAGDFTSTDAEQASASDAAVSADDDQAADAGAVSAEQAVEPAHAEGEDDVSFDALPAEEPVSGSDGQMAEQADVSDEPEPDPEPIEGEEPQDLAA